jgi:hypothetical protein
VTFSILADSANRHASLSLPAALSIPQTSFRKQAAMTLTSSEPTATLASRVRRAREVAESLNMHLPPRAGEVRIVEPRFALILGADPDPNLNVVQRLRLTADEVESAVQQVRRLAVDHDRHQLTWEVGPSATPANLHEHLLSLGMRPHTPEPLATGMLLTRPLATPPPEKVEVRLVETPEDFAAASRVLAQGFGMPATAEGLFGTYEQHRAQPQFRRYIACIGGEPVAAADATALDVGMVLAGGATLKSARGRGAYQALLHARFRDAERQSAPVLITQAGAMSRPILERLGFERVAEVHILLDIF